MIPIPPAQLVTVFITIWFAILTVLWLRDELGRAETDWNWTIAKDRLYTCSRCHYSFLAKDDSTNITRCPRCNEMCFLKKKKRL